MRAAESLAAIAAEQDRPIEIHHLDVMELVGSFFKKAYADGYIRLVDKHPQLWAYFYRRTDCANWDSTLNRFIQGVERFNARKLKTWLRRLDPDHVVCTHFLPAQFLSKMLDKGSWNKPVWVVITDFDCHGLWLMPHMTGYFTANAEVGWRLRLRGLRAERLEISGIPIMPQFARSYDRTECARAIGLDPQRTTLLMMAGGAGLAGLDVLAARLLDLPGDFQIIALAGRNAAMLTKLKQLEERATGRLVAHGFTTTIERLMACSDLAITKPGGLTTSECLAMGLPMVVTSPIPGQEERNADHLLENGCAVKAYDDATLAYKVHTLLGDPPRLARMRDRAAALGRPGAARRIIEVLLEQGTTSTPAR